MTDTRTTLDGLFDEVPSDLTAYFAQIADGSPALLPIYSTGCLRAMARMLFWL